jgi:hypothetical protein
MLYKITVFKIGDGKKKWIHSVELNALNPMQAVEKACVKMGPDRLMEISEVHHFARPTINRIHRDGFF